MLFICYTEEKIPQINFERSSQTREFQVIWQLGCGNGKRPVSVSVTNLPSRSCRLGCTAVAGQSQKGKNRKECQ